MIRTTITIIAFGIWNVMDFFNIRAVFDSFYILGESKKQGYRYFWLAYSFAVTYVYCCTKMYGPSIICNIFFFLFYLRMVPLIWSAYGFKIKIPAIVFFYGEMEAVVSSSITLVIANVAKFDWGTRSWIDDMLASLTSVLFFAVLSILKYMRQGRFRLWLANLSIWEYIILIGAIFFAGNIESVIWQMDYSLQSRIFAMILMTLVLMITLRLLFVNKKNFKMENLITVLERQMKDLTEYYREIDKKETEMRKFRHDTNNYMVVLYSLIKKGDNSQAIEYMNNLNEKFYSISKKYYQTGNCLVDSMLSSKSCTAEQNDIYFDLEGVVPEGKIEDVDTVTIFSNIIDNAIEACEKIEGKKIIHINSAYKNGTWAFEVINPVSSQVNIVNNHVDSSKGSPQIHGFGLSNIEDIVEKYHGTMKLKSEKNEFSINVTLHTE
ncbi:MAG: GHKL domain-containing protein [Lachnospiraceae bacterium]|nr:GHKL domain-containing protein [Lachnospiraceae bacterium]